MAKNSVKQDEQVKEAVKRKIILRLLKYMKPYKVEVIKTLLLTAVIIAVDLINPLFLKVGIDDYIEPKNYKGLLILAVFVVIANIISMICFKKRIETMLKATNEILMTIRQELYEHIQELSFNFFDHRPAGKILARIIGDVNSLKDLFLNSVTQLLPNFAKMLGALVIMLVIDYRLTLISMIMLPFLIVGMVIIEVHGHKRWQEYRKKNANLNAFTHENFSGIRIIKSFTAEERTEKTFLQLLKEHMKSFMKAIYLADLFWPMVDLSWGVGAAVVYIYGVVNLQGGRNITVGTLVGFISYIAMFWHPIMQLSNFYNTLINNISGAERIFDILDIKPDIVDAKDAMEMPRIEGKIEFKDVAFEYEADVPVLHQMSFTAKQGESIALVGPTGAGKSTIINLVSRFYDIKQGKILIDGVDIAQVTIESLRKQMGIMTQDTFMFSGTIKENIAYGKLGATDEEIIAAAKAVNAHEFIIEMDKGYDTNVNERGSRLSVGQRQLVAFARTILSDPKILILDEATSSIDTYTEKLVQKGIEKLLQGRTSFIIAHRLSTIEKADRIMFIDDGDIQEVGNHQELMEKQGRYYNLFMAQTKSMQCS